MVNCCVWNCKNRSERKQPGISFHRFPADENRKRQWLQRMQLDVNPGKYDRICSVHFERRFFYFTDSRMQLLRGAIPTRSLSYPPPSPELRQITKLSKNITLSMPKYCQVPDCNQENDEDIAYHPFPKNTQLKQKWLTAIGRPDYKPSSTSLICSRHFEETDFTYRFGKKILRNTVVPSMFDGEKIESEAEVQKPQPKEKPRKAARGKHSFHIPHYILVNRDLLNSDGTLDLRNLNADNLSPPILYGIGNTSTVMTSPDAVTSPFLKRKRKQDDPQKNEDDAPSKRKPLPHYSNAIKEVIEIHSYNKRPDDSPDSRSMSSDKKEEAKDEEIEEVEDEEEEEETSSKNALKNLQKYRDCSSEAIENPTAAQVAWNMIQRTINLQQKKIQSLQTEHDMLQNQLRRLQYDVREINIGN